MWLAMLGAANAVLENSHLRSDTLTMLIKNKKVLNTIMRCQISITYCFGIFRYFVFPHVTV